MRTVHEETSGLKDYVATTALAAIADHAASWVLRGQLVSKAHEVSKVSVGIPDPKAVAGLLEGPAPSSPADAAPEATTDLKAWRPSTYEAWRIAVQVVPMEARCSRWYSDSVASAYT